LTCRHRHPPAETARASSEAFYQGRTPQGGHLKGTASACLSCSVRARTRRHRRDRHGEFAGAHFRLRLPMRQLAGEPKETGACGMNG